MGTDLDFTANRLEPAQFANMPAGLERHILCSQQVSAEETAHIDRAIAAIHLPTS